MNASPLLRRTSAFVCRACRNGHNTQQMLRQLSTSRPARTPSSPAHAFQSYTLPSHPPSARPRNADVAVDTSIATAIESPTLPRVHETRPPAPTPQPREKRIISEAEAQESREEFVAKEPTPTPTPEPTPTLAREASAAPTPRKSKLRAPRKAAMRLTPAAVEQLRALLDQPEPKLIKVGVRNRGCSGLAYHLEFVDKASAFDETVEQDGVKVLIDSKALFSIIGSEMDWVEDKLSQKFLFRNPNIKEECGCGESFMV